MADSSYLRIRNFERFQSFNRKNLKGNPHPDWIKLWVALLGDRMFYRLPDAAKFHVVGMMLLASQFDNRIPYDLPWIEHQISATESIDIKAVLASRFIELVEGGKTQEMELSHLEGRDSETIDSRQHEREQKERGGTDTSELSLLEGRKSKKGPEEEEKSKSKRREEGEENGESASRTRHKTAAPEILEITRTMAAWAESEGFESSDLQAEAAAMLDHFRAKGERRADWAATWRTWMRNTRRFGRSSGNGQFASKAKRLTAERNEDVRGFLRDLDANACGDDQDA